MLRRARSAMIFSRNQLTAGLGLVAWFVLRHSRIRLRHAYSFVARVKKTGDSSSVLRMELAVSRVRLSRRALGESGRAER